VAQVASEWGLSGAETLIELIWREHNRVGCVMFNRDEDDMRTFLAHPLAMVGSDGSAIAPYGPFAATKPHPRFYGTYPRVLGRYVREFSVLSLEDAVRKMSGLPAERFGLRDRGVIAEKMMADVVVFDPVTIVDQATFEDPHAYPVGISHVLVSGQVVVDNGEHTGKLPGRVLRAGA
jgi:N-acyl-D-amino-acid deacylase